MNELTREQILGMDKRQLAEATAVHVMKWKTIAKPNTGEYVYMKSFDEQGRIDEYIEVELWNPAEDIAAAWEVLEKFKLCQVTMSETGFSHSDLKYRVIVGKNQNVAYADTAPEAICKAALLAVLGL